MTSTREHLFDLRQLENYTFVDEFGKDQGINGIVYCSFFQLLATGLLFSMLFDGYFELTLRKMDVDQMSDLLKEVSHKWVVFTRESSYAFSAS